MSLESVRAAVHGLEMSPYQRGDAQVELDNLIALLHESRDLHVMCTLIDKSGQCKAIVDKIDKMFPEFDQ